MNSLANIPILPSKTRIGLLLLPVIMAGLLLLMLRQAAQAGTVPEAEGVITVCPAGPPECDYAAIQVGINAATAGDTVLVGPGTYTEQLSLTSGITLTSSHGLTETIVTAPTGPLLRAHSITSGTIDGFTFKGSGEMSLALGISLTDVVLTLNNVHLARIEGIQDYNHENTNAIGMWINGTGYIQTNNFHLNNVHGGVDGYATGIHADGNYNLTLKNSSLTRIYSGDGGAYCSFDAIAIQATGYVRLRMEQVAVRSIRAGFGCYSGPCDTLIGGDAIGLLANNGQVVIDDSSFQGFSNPNHVGFRSGILVENGALVEITDSIVGNNSFAPLISSEDGRCTYDQSFMGISITGVNNVSISQSLVENFYNLSAPTGGYGLGIHIQDSQNVELTRNQVNDIRGGYFRTEGIFLESGINHALVDSNLIRNISAPNAYSSFGSDVGGPGASGISANVVDGVIQNNIIHQISGGNGNGPTANGGGATGLHAALNGGLVRNNTIHLTIPGSPGSMGAPGTGTGLVLIGNGLQVYNNLLVNHDVGMANFASNIFMDYQGLFFNDKDYSNYSGGPNDVSGDPLFASLADLDFHLLPESPFIDQGFLSNGPPTDFDGEPRPLDATDQHFAIMDIGMDEYWPGMRGSSMIQDPIHAMAGDELAVTMTLVNPSTIYPRSGVILTNPTPVDTEYVPDTLAATAGNSSFSHGIITWVGNVEPAGAVTITYRLQVSLTLTEPTTIRNEAFIDDGIAANLQLLRAVSFVNGRKMYLPMSFNQPPP